MEEEKFIISDIDKNKYFVLRRKVFSFFLTALIIWLYFMICWMPKEIPYSPIPMGINGVIFYTMGITIHAIIVFLFLFCLITNLLYIIKHKSDLKYLFKINKEHKFRDISQFIVHFLMIALFIIFNFSFDIDAKPQREDKMLYFYANRSIWNYLNAATKLDYQLENKTNVSNENDFVNSVIRRTTPIKLYSFSYQGITSVDFSEEDIKRNNLEEIKKKPTVFYDKKMFTVIKFKNGCSFYDDENIINSDCVILIDGNGLTPPNEQDKDRAYLYIKGDEVPAKIIPEKSLRG